VDHLSNAALNFLDEPFEHFDLHRYSFVLGALEFGFEVVGINSPLFILVGLDSSFPCFGVMPRNANMACRVKVTVITHISRSSHSLPLA
jgi:hypothetical protein